MPYEFILYLLLGMLPAFLWLLYFLRKDIHPESRKEIAKIFLFGALATGPTFFVELALTKVFALNFIPSLIGSFLSIFIGIALVEEVAKYLVVRFKALPSPEFDEPMDTIIYMVTSAMGFAGVENIILFFSPAFNQSNLLDPFLLSLVRFLGATLIHALASATVGFFIALSILHQKHHIRWLIAGLTIATILHGLYNFAIIKFEAGLKLLVLLAVIITLASIVAVSLKKVRQLKAVCEP